MWQVRLVVLAKFNYTISIKMLGPEEVVEA